MNAPCFTSAQNSFLSRTSAVQDRTAVEEDYQLVSAAEVILNEPRDLRDAVLAQRADKEESDSEDQENVRDSSDRLMGAVSIRPQAAPQPVDQKPAKQIRKKARLSQVPTHPYSPPRPVPLDPFDQPQQAQPERAHLMDEGPSPSSAAAAAAAAAPAARQHNPQAAPSIRDAPNSHMQGTAQRAQRLPDTRPQVEVLDAQSRETRMCAWCPTDAVLASG